MMSDILSEALKIFILVMVFLAVTYASIPGAMKLRVNQIISNLTNIPESTITQRISRIFDLTEALEERQEKLELMKAKPKETAKSQVYQYESYVKDATNTYNAHRSMNIDDRVKHLRNIKKQMEAVAPNADPQKYLSWVLNADKYPSTSTMAYNMNEIGEYISELENIQSKLNTIYIRDEQVRDTSTNPLSTNNINPIQEYDQLIQDVATWEATYLDSNLMESEKSEARAAISNLNTWLATQKTTFIDACTAQDCCYSDGSTRQDWENGEGLTGGGCTNQGTTVHNQTGPHHICQQFGNTQQFTCINQA